MKNDKVQLAYNFLLEKEVANSNFTIDEIISATSWKKATILTYVNKQWCNFIVKTDGAYKTVGLTNLTFLEFLKIHSQKRGTVQKIDLKDILVDKSRQFALMAIYVYNSPFSSFRVHGFIMNMIVAWTSLLHSIFEEQGITYVYKNNRTWDLAECIKHYWKGDNNAVVINLNFLLGLRHVIEHKDLPEINMRVCGHCQACLINFEDLLIEKYGNSHALMQNLTVALQLSRNSNLEQERALKQLQIQNFELVNQYMDKFENDLSSEILSSKKYRIGLFLVPKISNHRSSSDIFVEFCNIDETNPEEIKELNKYVVAIREKHKEQLEHYLRPTKVAHIVRDRLGKKFTIGYHTNAWKIYKVRPNNREDRDKCDKKYVQWNDLVNDYLYSDKWVDFLVKQLSTDQEYNKISSGLRT